MLGFGASGKELAEKWEIKYLGSETLKDGETSVETEKLELVAKDPDVRKMFPKVTIWMDPERGVSLKQVFDEGQGQSRTCFYFNIKVNQPLPRQRLHLQNRQPDHIHQIEAAIPFFLFPILFNPHNRNSSQHKQHRKALQRIARLGCFDRHQQGAAQHHISQHPPPEARPQTQPRQSQQQIKRVQPRVGPTEARLGVVMRIDPPVQIDGQIFNPRPQPHIGQPAQRQPEIIAQRMRGDPLLGQPRKPRIHLRQSIPAHCPL